MADNETVKRMRAATEAFMRDLRRKFDIGALEWRPEAEQWANIEHQITILLITAYKRNHTL